MNQAVLLIGPPGAGKSTQAKLILKEYPAKLTYFSSGDMIRALKDDQRVKDYLKYDYPRGKLLDDETTTTLFRETLARIVHDHEYTPYWDTLLLDGIPRNIPQAEMLEDDLRVKAVLQLAKVDEATLEARMLDRANTLGRSDDTPEAIRHRIRGYFLETQPLVEHYRAKGATVHVIDAHEDPHEVFSQIYDALWNREEPL